MTEIEDLRRRLAQVEEKYADLVNSTDGEPLTGSGKMKPLSLGSISAEGLSALSDALGKAASGGIDNALRGGGKGAIADLSASLGESIKKMGGKGKGGQLFANFLSLGPKAAEGMLSMSDSLNQFEQKISESTLASEPLITSADDSRKAFASMGKGMKDAMTTTGQSMGEAAEGMKTFNATSSSVGVGFGTISTAAARAEASNAAYSESVIVSRNVGLDFASTSGLISDALVSQGQTAHETSASIALLKVKTQDTGLSMGFGAGKMKDIILQSKHLNLDTNKLAASLGAVGKAQNELAASGNKAFKSPQTAVETYTTALSKTIEKQQDFGEALFVAGVQGKGLEGMLDFMDADAGDAFKQSIEATTKLLGGKILTREEAKAPGGPGLGTYMAQASQIKEQYGFKSDKEALNFMELLPRIQAGGDDGTKAQEEATAALEEVQNADKVHFQQMFTQGQVQNQLLGGVFAGIVQMSAGLGRALKTTQRAGKEALVEKAEQSTLGQLMAGLEKEGSGFVEGMQKKADKAEPSSDKATTEAETLNNDAANKKANAASTAKEAERAELAVKAAKATKADPSAIEALEEAAKNKRDASEKAYVAEKAAMEKAKAPAEKVAKAKTLATTTTPQKTLESAVAESAGTLQNTFLKQGSNVGGQRSALDPTSVSVGSGIPNINDIQIGQKQLAATPESKKGDVTKEAAADQKAALTKSTSTSTTASADSTQKTETAAAEQEQYANINLVLNIDGDKVYTKMYPKMKVDFKQNSAASKQT